MLLITFGILDSRQKPTWLYRRACGFTRSFSVCPGSSFRVSASTYSSDEALCNPAPNMHGWAWAPRASLPRHVRNLVMVQRNPCSLPESPDLHHV